MQTKEEMVKFLVQTSVLHTPAIKAAFTSIDRKDFVQHKDKSNPYLDFPLAIGHNQTISQPWTVAFMLELLQPQQGDKILDVGSGSGWTTALLAHIVGEEGRVCGVELIPELVDFGQKNLKEYIFEQVTIQQARELGLPKHAPYDKIMVSAAADKLPKALVDQLKTGGRMVIPIQSSIWLVEKTSSGITEKEYPGFAFVPLRINNN